MAAAAVSAADAPSVGHVPAPFDASCRGREGLKHGMRETLDHVLAGAAVDALLLAGLVSHLVSGCATKSFRRLALNRLLRVTRVSAAARDLVGHAGFVSLLGVAERGTTLASLVIPVLMNTASSASVSTAVLGEVILPTLRRLLALGSRFPSCTVFGLVDYLLLNAPAATQAFLECGIVAWLDMHLEQGFCRARDDPWVARALIQISIRFLDTPDHREAVLPLYRYFPSALSLFLRLTSSDDLAKLVINAARGLYLSTFDASIHRTAIAVSLLIDKPGALASLAHLAFVRPPQLHDQYAKLIARCLMRTYLAPQAFLFPSMLDEFFTLPALCSVDFEPPDAARLMAICTTPVALHYLTQPLARQRVCAAASLAHFANLDDLFVGHLADGAHLNALLDAAIEAATAPADAAAVMPGGSSREWHTTALLSAVSLAARACRVTTPAAAAAAEDKKHTRRKRPRVGMDASDVGVQHRSSTVFLIAARPFYVQIIALKKVSPILKQAMEAAGSSREPIALPLAIDAPVNRHHALFGLAVEFAYTGAISRLSDDDALPLFTLAEFLQIDAVRSYLLDTRLRRLMHADLAFTERA